MKKQIITIPKETNNKNTNKLPLNTSMNSTYKQTEN